MLIECTSTASATKIVHKNYKVKHIHTTAVFPTVQSVAVFHKSIRNRLGLGLAVWVLK